MPGFDASGPYAIMLYIYLAAIPLATLQCWRRRSLEMRFKLQA